MDDDNSRNEHQNDGESNRFGNGSDSTGSLVLRPVFLGNLNNTFTAEDVMDVFERPITPSNTTFNSIPVDRVDLKRGYCFVFLKDAVSQEAKQNAERFVSDINGMYVPTRLSSYAVYHVLRAPFESSSNLHDLSYIIHLSRALFRRRLS